MPPNLAEAEQRQATRNMSAPDRLAEAQKMLSEAGDDRLPQTPLPNAFSGLTSKLSRIAARSWQHGKLFLPC